MIVQVRARPHSGRMREKVLAFMRLVNFEATADLVAENLVGQFDTGFKSAFGEELPTDAAEALVVVKTALIEHRDLLERAVAEVYEKHFTEAEIDALLAFYQSPIGRRLAEIGSAIQTAIAEASNAWTNDAIKSVEPHLTRLLGTPEPAAAAAAAVPANDTDLEPTAPTAA